MFQTAARVCGVANILQRTDAQPDTLPDPSIDQRIVAYLSLIVRAAEIDRLHGVLNQVRSNVVAS